MSIFAGIVLLAVALFAGPADEGAAWRLRAVLGPASFWVGVLLIVGGIGRGTHRASRANADPSAAALTGNVAADSFHDHGAGGHHGGDYGAGSGDGGI